VDASDAAKLRDLEAENYKLKKLPTKAHLDIHALDSVFGVKRLPHKSNTRPSPK